jgi:hypothetical protein
VRFAYLYIQIYFQAIYENLKGLKSSATPKCQSQDGQRRRQRRTNARPVFLIDFFFVILQFKFQKNMNHKIDMNYRFTDDQEPSDEQLTMIMQEVGEDVRRESAEISKRLQEQIQYEYSLATYAL